MKSLRNPENKQELLQRIQRVRLDSLRHWGKMSAHQMICHLADGYRVYRGEILAEPEPFPALAKKIIKTVALYMPWPRGVIPTLPSIDQVAGRGTRPADFGNDVLTLYEYIERFAQLPESYIWPQQHPGLGALSYSQWMRLGYRHADHHLSQFGA